MDGRQDGWTNGSFEGLIRAELAESGNQPQTPWVPTLPSGGGESQDPRPGGDGSWRCGYSLPGLQAGGESPRTSGAQFLLQVF